MNPRGVTLVQAQELLIICLKKARELSMSPLSIAVLDNGGHLKAYASEDGSGTQRGKIAQGKANAALGMGFGTRQFSNLVKQGVLPEMFASTINGANNGEFIPLPGGVLILENDVIIGAIGISGASSNEDEQIAISAIQSCNLFASP